MLTKYNPYKEYLKRDELLAPFDAMISDFLNSSGFRNVPKEFMIKGTYPKCNIYESDSETICIEAGVPGLTREDIDIQVEDNILSISFKSNATKNNYLIKELKQSSSTRSFFLNDNLNTDDIEASVKNGLLTITIKKIKPNQEANKIKKIKIK